MPLLSITYQQFKDRTHRSFPRYRSRRLKDVLDALQAYEHDAVPPDQGIRDLREALRRWGQTDPKEFANRDRKSGGLATQLMEEVGLSPTNLGRPAPDLLAYSVVGISRANELKRPETTYTPLGTTAVDHLMDLVHKGQKVGIVLIDVQGSDGTMTVETKKSEGFTVRFNHRTVLDNQAELLEAADECGTTVPVFEVITPTSKTDTTTKTVGELSMHFPDPSGLVTFRKQISNTCHPENAALNSGKTLAEKIDDKLKVSAKEESRRQVTLFVIGFDANQCVKATVFGTLGYTKGGKKEYFGGLLDLGYTVVTSRILLASSGHPLEDEWGPLANM